MYYVGCLYLILDLNNILFRGKHIWIGQQALPIFKPFTNKVHSQGHIDDYMSV